MSGYPNQNPPHGYRPPGVPQPGMPHPGAPRPGTPYPPQGVGPPQKPSGGSNGCLIAAIVVLVVVGIPAVLICAGIGYFAFFVTSKVNEAQAKIKEEHAKFEQHVMGLPTNAGFPEDKKITTVEEAIEALNTDHWAIPAKGADFLGSCPIDAGKKTIVLAALEPKLTGFNGDLHAKCLKAFGLWGSKENAPAVAKCLSAFGGNKVLACEILGKWKDPSVAAELTKILNDGGGDGKAAESALIQIGNGCEAAVRAELDLDRREAHARAERILAAYGVDVPDAIITARLENIKADRQKRESVKSLSLLPLKPPRQKDVARALERVVAENDHVTRDDALKGLLTWGDKESAIAVARFMKSETFVNKHAVELLAQQKEPSTIDAFIAIFDNAFISDPEFNKALVEFGPAGEKAALAAMHDERNRARERARTILAELKTTPDAMLTQTLMDLSSPKSGTVRSAIEWLRTAPVDASRKKELSTKLAALARDGSGFVQGEAIETLVRLGDPSSGTVLIDLWREGSTQGRVTGALMKAGPSAEDLLISLLENSDPQVVGSACLALQRGCGTEKSLKPLQAVLRKAGAGGNRQLTAIARGALDALQKKSGG